MLKILHKENSGKATTLNYGINFAKGEILTILDDKIDTHGMIFIGGKFVDLNFEEKMIQEEIVIKKKDDLAILVQYTQQIFSKKIC